MADTLKSRCKRFVQFVHPQVPCDWIPLSGGVIGRGVKGYAIKACGVNCGDADGCIYVAKILPSFETDQLRKETEMGHKFHTLGLAPAILDVFVCDGEATIMMEAVDMTLKRYIQRLIEEKVALHDIYDIIDQLEEATLERVRLAHAHGLAHRDLHLENVMVNVNDDMSVNNILFIDFGKSKQYLTRGEQPDVDAADDEESESDIKLSFDLLKKQAKDGRIVMIEEKGKKMRDSELDVDFYDTWKPLHAPYNVEQVQRRASPPRSQASARLISRGRGLFDATPSKPSPSIFDDDEDDSFLSRSRSNATPHTPRTPRTPMTPRTPKSASPKKGKNLFASFSDYIDE